jgi:hypothetical protein
MFLRRIPQMAPIVRRRTIFLRGARCREQNEKRGQMSPSLSWKQREEQASAPTSPSESDEHALTFPMRSSRDWLTK